MAEMLPDIFLFNIVSKLTVPSAFERDSVNFCVYSGGRNGWESREWVRESRDIAVKSSKIVCIGLGATPHT